MVKKLVFVILLVLVVAVFFYILNYCISTKESYFHNNSTSVSHNNIVYRAPFSNKEDHFYFNNNLGFVVSGIIPNEWQIDYSSDPADPTLYFSFSLTKGEYKIQIDRFSRGLGCIYSNSPKYLQPSNPKYPYEGKVKMQREINNVTGYTYRLNEATKQDKEFVYGVCEEVVDNSNSFTTSGINILTPITPDLTVINEITGILEKLVLIYD